MGSWGRRFWHFWSQIGVEESIGVGFIWIGVDPEKSIFWHPHPPAPQGWCFRIFFSRFRDQGPISYRFYRTQKNPWPLSHRPGDPYIGMLHAKIENVAKIMPTRGIYVSRHGQRGVRLTQNLRSGPKHKGPPYDFFSKFSKIFWQKHKNPPCFSAKFFCWKTLIFKRKTLRNFRQKFCWNPWVNAITSAAGEKLFEKCLFLSWKCSANFDF